MSISHQTAAPRSRNILSREQAIEIFQLKSNIKSMGVRTSLIAEQYGVSAKAIRDIWVGRTWYRDTFLLDTSRADAEERFMRKIGRPAGARDVKPRARRKDKEHELTKQKKPIQKDPEDSSFSPLHLVPSKEQNHRESDSSKPDASGKDLLLQSTAVGSVDQSTEFVDPFYSDWPYWHTAK